MDHDMDSGSNVSNNNNSQNRRDEEQDNSSTTGNNTRPHLKRKVPEDTSSNNDNGAQRVEERRSWSKDFVLVYVELYKPTDAHLGDLVEKILSTGIRTTSNIAHRINTSSNLMEKSKAIAVACHRDDLTKLQQVVTDISTYIGRFTNAKQIRLINKGLFPVKLSGPFDNKLNPTLIESVARAANIQVTNVTPGGNYVNPQQYVATVDFFAYVPNYKDAVALHNTFSLRFGSGRDAPRLTAFLNWKAISEICVATLHIKKFPRDFHSHETTLSFILARAKETETPQECIKGFFHPKEEHDGKFITTSLFIAFATMESAYSFSNPEFPWVYGGKCIAFIKRNFEIYDD